MSHKQVEQHRRLKAKQYFDELRCLIPNGTDPKCDRNRFSFRSLPDSQAVKYTLMGFKFDVGSCKLQLNT